MILSLTEFNENVKYHRFNMEGIRSVRDRSLFIAWGGGGGVGGFWGKHDEI